MTVYANNRIVFYFFINLYIIFNFLGGALNEDIFVEAWESSNIQTGDQLVDYHFGI